MFLAMALFVYRAWTSTAALDAAAALMEKSNQSYPSEDEHAEDGELMTRSATSDAASHFLPPPSSFLPLRSLRSRQIQPTSSFLTDSIEDEGEKSGDARSSISRSLREPLL
jgi:hypothetical protein